MKRFLVLSLCVVSLPLVAQTSSKKVSTFTLTSEQFSAEILKVFEATSEDGAVYLAYLVCWRNQEVVVEAPGNNTGEKKLKVGDTVTLTAYSTEFSIREGKPRISFRASAFPFDESQRIEAIAEDVRRRRLERQQATKRLIKGDVVPKRSAVD